MKYAECPNYERMVTTNDTPRVGQQVVCKNCNTKLEISWLDPLELDWPSDYKDSSYEEDEDEQFAYEEYGDDYDYEEE